MIQDQWRTGRSPEGMEGDFGPSMVEPSYNPTIRDYLTNPGLVARRAYYDDGKEISDDTPDPWNDEPVYTPIKTGPRKSARKKTEAQPQTPNEAQGEAVPAKDDEEHRDEEVEQ